MPDKGIMVYGYEREDAEKIKESFEGALGKELRMLSATDQEDRLVGDVLEEPEDNYRDLRTKMVMLLDFESDDEIRSVMKAFPLDKGVEEPIFCQPTEKNVGWSVNDLLEDLLGEQMFFSRHRTPPE